MLENLENSTVVNKLEYINLCSNTKEGGRTEYANHRIISLITHANKIMLRIIQHSLEPYMERELPDVQTGIWISQGT